MYHPSTASMMTSMPAHNVIANTATTTTEPKLHVDTNTPQPTPPTSPKHATTATTDTKTTRTTTAAMPPTATTSTGAASGRIKLDVGGVHYSTSLTTLTAREPDSLLAHMFTKPFKVTPEGISDHWLSLVDVHRSIIYR
jgi:hypothetical protein